MANSRVAVMNLALQLLGAARIGSPTEAGKGAEELNACYDPLRDAEQRARFWNFTLERAILAPHATAPVFHYGYAFPLPTGCLRIMKPTRTTVDWSLENHAGAPSILTNDGTSIPLRYVKRVTDEAKFDPLFTIMLACSLAWWCCETITQSNKKKESIEKRYALARTEARQTNAFEKVPLQSAPDEWLTAMSNGGLADSSWLQE